MSTGLLIEVDAHEVVVPPEAMADLSAFRRWALSDDFPETGRIDYVGGNIELHDMAGEELDSHGALKGEIYAAILASAKASKLGHVYTDSVRVSCPDAALSAEPDVVLVTYEAVESGRLRRVPKAAGEPDRFVEIEGLPDLVVEVVSDSTIRKDTVRLPRAYFDAGVTEFWLADGRKDLTFIIHARGRTKFEPVAVDADGFQHSTVLGRFFRLERTRDRIGAWQYDLGSR